jgi:vacuolar-type H+-ATPase subunit H
MNSKKISKLIKTHDKNGFLINRFNHPLKYLLDFDDKRAYYYVYNNKYVKYPFCELALPLYNTCSDFVINYVQLINKIITKNFNYIKYFANNYYNYIIFNDKNKDLSILYYYIINNFYKVKTKTKKEKNKYAFIVNYLRNPNKNQMRGELMFAHLYGKGPIPLPKNIKDAINKKVKATLKACKENDTISYKSEYKMRFEIAKKMSNNFKYFDKEFNKIYSETKMSITEMLKSNSFLKFKNNVTVNKTSKLSIKKMFKEVDQEDLLTKLVMSQIK